MAKNTDFWKVRAPGQKFELLTPKTVERSIARDRVSLSVRLGVKRIIKSEGIFFPPAVRETSVNQSKLTGTTLRVKYRVVRMLSDDCETWEERPSF